MSPKEKADELFDKLSWAMVPDGQSVRTAGIIKQAKQCAIICVEQIMEAMNDRLDDSCEAMVTEYWMQVLEHLKSS